MKFLFRHAVCRWDGSEYNKPVSTAATTVYFAVCGHHWFYSKQNCEPSVLAMEWIFRHVENICWSGCIRSGLVNNSDNRIDMQFRISLGCHFRTDAQFSGRPKLEYQLNLVWFQFSDSITNANHSRRFFLYRLLVPFLHRKWCHRRSPCRPCSERLSSPWPFRFYDWINFIVIPW